MYYVLLPLFILITLAYSVAVMICYPFDRRGRLYGTMFRSWSKLALPILRVKIVKRGVEKLDPNATYVFVANHSSYLDIPALGASLPNDVVFVLKEELTKVPIWGWGLKLSPQVIIRRTDPRDALGGIERAAEQIRNGTASVIIFPEGTRSSDGKLQEFKRGAFMLAAKTGVTVVPVAVRDAHRLLHRDDWRVRPGTIEVIVGTPIQSRAGLNRAEERALQAEAFAQIDEMLKLP